MVELISPPDPRTLLPALLACLPTAFLSPQPPPALLPLLSPILRQRVKILSSVSSSSNEKWLQLLCWSPEAADRLEKVIGNTTFEPHPVSGEIELGDEIPVTYKRIDEETLRAQLLVPDYQLAVHYLWCPEDEQGGGRGWRVAELLPRETPSADEHTWSSSIGEANEKARQNLYSVLDSPPQSQFNDVEEEEEDDDADYWARYDSTPGPGRTPGPKTPAPNSGFSNMPASLSEESYYSQYGDVQPAMDSQDPDEEEEAEVGPSSLKGDMLADLLRQRMTTHDESESPREQDYEYSSPLSHPRPESRSTSSSYSDTVAKLEMEAERETSNEIGVKQHIGTSIKSLFRLAKATGINRAEFQAMVQTECELLELMDED